MTIKYALPTLICLIAVLFAACVDEETLIYAPEPELPAQLANYSEPEVSDGYWLNTSRFYVTDAGATLGRVLFYDKILSRTNQVSCGSCHLQEHSFADTKVFSEGIKDQVLTRNTPSISNVYDDFFYFWDGRVETLDELSLKPVRNHREMGLDDPDFLIAKIEKASYYPALFKQAFGTEEVTETRIADAMAQFMSSMISANSKFDEVMAGNATFTGLEQQGQAIFFGEGRCYQCHLGQDLNERGGFGGGWGDPVANIGLDVNYEDPGLGEFDPEREGEFKIPTLRNIAVTAPYMHDGRFATLEEVVNHYNKNIQPHENLAFELRDWNTDGPARMGLDEVEVQSLVAFLKTMTDQEFLAAERFSDPFK